MKVLLIMIDFQIEFSYARGAISHTMHLKAYADVGFDPSKLTLHVVKSKHCRARIHNVSCSKATFYFFHLLFYLSAIRYCRILPNMSILYKLKAFEMCDAMQRFNPIIR